jgi:hypothetical protein
MNVRIPGLTLSRNRAASRALPGLGRGPPPTVLAMGQNRQKTGKTCLLPPSTSSGRMEPE